MVAFCFAFLFAFLTFFYLKGQQGDSGYSGAEGRPGAMVRNIYKQNSRLLLVIFASISYVIGAGHVVVQFQLSNYNFLWVVLFNFKMTDNNDA